MKLVITLSVGLARTYTVYRQLTRVCIEITGVWMWQRQVFTDLSSISSILNKTFCRSALASGCLRLPLLAQALQAHTLSRPLSHLRQKRQRVTDVRFFFNYDWEKSLVSLECDLKVTFSHHYFPTLK